MTSWDAAMLGLTPFMRGHQMMRTWLALMGASLSTFVVHDAVGYFLVDVTAAGIVMSKPSSLPQRLIGALFTLMAVYDFGFWAAGALFGLQGDWTLFTSALRYTGWAQWAVLAGWAGHDFLGRFVRWNGPADSASLARERRIR